MPNSLYFRKIFRGYFGRMDLFAYGDHVSELTLDSVINILNRSKFKIIGVRGIHFEIPILARWFSFAKQVHCKNPMLSKSIIYVVEKKE